MSAPRRKVRFDVRAHVETGARDAAGQAVKEWQTVHAGLWGDLRHRSGMAAVRSDADASIVRASIRTRLRDTITADMRIVRGAREYRIVAILPDEGGAHTMDIVCEWGGVQGAA